MTSTRWQTKDNQGSLPATCYVLIIGSITHLAFLDHCIIVQKTYTTLYGSALKYPKVQPAPIQQVAIYSINIISNTNIHLVLPSGKLT